MNDENRFMRTEKESRMKDEARTTSAGRPKDSGFILHPSSFILLLALLLSLARVNAIEDPPGCSLQSGGGGNTSVGGINFNLSQAHVGDAVPAFPNLGMASSGCRAVNVTGVVYIATGPLTNFLINVTLDPGFPISCPGLAPCQPGPYNILITPA